MDNFKDDLKKEFQFLPLCEYFENTFFPLSKLHYAYQSITSCGKHDFFGGSLTSDGWMQFFLLTTAFFGSGDQENTIYDTRHIPPTPLKCLDFPNLLEKIASLFLVYESQRRDIDILTDNFKSSIDQGLNWAIHIIQSAKLLHSQGGLPKGLNIKELQNSSRTLIEVHEALLPQGYLNLHKSKKENEARDLEVHILIIAQDYFRKYGPASRYPAAAIFRCLAEILCLLRIEEPPTEHPDPLLIVAERLKKRVQRAKQEPN